MSNYPLEVLLAAEARAIAARDANEAPASLMRELLSVAGRWLPR